MDTIIEFKPSIIELLEIKKSIVNDNRLSLCDKINIQSIINNQINTLVELNAN